MYSSYALLENICEKNQKYCFVLNHNLWNHDGKLQGDCLNQGEDGQQQIIKTDSRKLEKEKIAMCEFIIRIYV